MGQAVQPATLATARANVKRAAKPLTRMLLDKVHTSPPKQIRKARADALFVRDEKIARRLQRTPTSRRTTP